MSDLFIATAGAVSSNQTLLFIHGIGVDHTPFRPWFDTLADEYRLVFYDQRLNGRSPRSSTRPVDLDVMVDDAQSVMRAVGAGSTVLVAHSAGFWTALHVAKRCSQVTGVIMIAPAHSTEFARVLGSHVSRTGTQMQQEGISALLTGQVTTDVQLTEVLGRLWPLYFVDADHEAVHRLAETPCSVVGFGSFLTTCFGAFDWRVVLPQLPQPVLVIAGAQDWLESDPATAAAAVADASSRASLRVLAEAGHFPFIEKRDECIGQIRDWLHTEFVGS